MSWEFGTPNLGFISLPAGAVSVGWLEIGGRSRGVTGRMNADRKALKRTWSFPLKPWLSEEDWRFLRFLHEHTPGPFTLVDSSAPNVLSPARHLGVGWVTSAGVAINPSSHRMYISSIPATVQLGKSNNPTVDSLVAVSHDVDHWVSITFEQQSAFTGTVDLYAYAGTPSGIGDQVGTVAVTSSGRYQVYFYSDAYDYLSIRCTRSAGSGYFYDPVVNIGPAATKPSFHDVVMDLTQTSHIAAGRRSSFTVTLTEV